MNYNRFKLPMICYPVLATVGAIFPLVWVSWANQPVIFSRDKVVIDDLQTNRSEHVSFESADSSESEITSFSATEKSNIGHTKQATQAAKIVNQALVSLARYDSIQSQLITHTENIFASSIQAKGVYLQSGNVPHLRMMLALEFESSTDPIKVVQTTDEHQRYLWSICQSPFVQQADRIDLVKVKSVITNQKDQIGLINPMGQLPISGLPGLLLEINRRFDFKSVQQATISDQSVYLISGKIKYESLLRAVSRDSIEKQAGLSQQSHESLCTSLPHHIPTHIQLALRQSDLFPVWLEYARHKTSEKDLSQKIVLLSLAMHNIKINESIPKSAFQTDIQVTNWNDATETTIASMTGNKIR